MSMDTASCAAKLDSAAALDSSLKTNTHNNAFDTIFPQGTKF